MYLVRILTGVLWFKYVPITNHLRKDTACKQVNGVKLYVKNGIVSKLLRNIQFQEKSV